MANEVLGTFQTASFKGVEFLFTDSSQTGGRKNKTFEYPDRNTRYIEDLGQLQRTYKMTATIADSSASYKVSRKNFIDALESEGPGILVHPIDGPKRVFAMPYTLVEDISKAGVAVFNVEFLETGQQNLPTVTPSYASKIAQELNNTVNELNSDFTKIWTISNNFRGNLQYSIDLIDSLISRFKSASQISSDNIQAYSNLLDSLSNLSKNKYSYVGNSQTLSSKISELFDQTGQLNTSSIDNLPVMQSFFEFQSADIESITTIPLNERQKNRAILNININLQSLMYYYLFVSNTTFDTEDDVNLQRQIMLDQYNYIISTNVFVDLVEGRLELLPQKTFDLLESLKISANKSLDEQLATARRIINVVANPTSLLPFTYSYYGNLDYYDGLYNLNNLTDASQLSGNVKVFTDEN